MKKRRILGKKRKLEKEDICRLHWIRGLALSPDEQKVAYTVEYVTEDRRKYQTHIYMADIASRSSKPYTFGAVSDHDPVWSPDGKKLAFISTRDKKTAIYIIPADGGAEQKILEKDGAFSSLNWTPDSRRLVFAFRYNDSHDIADETKKKEAPLFRHITRLFYRLDGSGFLPQDRFHIYRHDIEMAQTHQLTKGKYDEVMPSVSPDGKSIVYVTNRSLDPDVDSLRDDLYIIPLRGGRPRKVKTPAGPKAAPVFSPDSKKIAYLGHAHPDDAWGVANFHVWVVGAKGKPSAVDLMPKFDRSALDATIGDMGETHDAAPLTWSGDGKKIFFTASDTGSTHLFYIPARGGLPTRVTARPGHVKAYSLGKSSRTAAIVVSDLADPGRLEIIKPDFHGDKKAITLADPNRELINSLNMPRTREVWFRGHDGFDLQGWLVTPPGFRRTKKYPAILEIHGGPRAQYGFTFFHEMNLLASEGYVVFYTNPRGGQGRGELFADAITGCWGEIDYFDCMAAADYLEKLPFVNKNRIGVTGGSYGGFMTNWIVGHTDRFKAAVTQRSVVNLISFYGSSDMGFSIDREFGDPWKNYDNYVKYSPLTYARKVKTPLLIIHNESDLRCGIEQAEELFTYLKRLRKKVEMVRFPEEPHGLSRHGRPDRRVARLDWILKWFDKYLKGR